MEARPASGVSLVRAATAAAELGDVTARGRLWATPHLVDNASEPGAIRDPDRPQVLITVLWVGDPGRL